MNKQIYVPDWNELNKEEQEVFQAWLQSLVVFLNSHIRLRDKFSNQVEEAKETVSFNIRDLENLINTDELITI
jgi:hypothetical protein